MSRFTNFFKSEPSESESKLSNFTQRSSKFFSAMLDSKDVCKICQCNFKVITTNKYFCSSCSQAVCKEHSSEVVGESIERLCDVCRDDKIREETETKTQDLKAELFKEIRGLQDERVSKTREVSKIGSKIRKLGNEHKENLLKYNTEQEEMREDLEKQKTITAAIDAEFKELKMQLEKAQISEGKVNIKLKRVNEVLQDIKVEVETIESENVEHKNLLEELKASAQQKVQIKMVKENLCKLCLMKVSLTHAVMFKNVLPTNDEKKSSIQNHEEIKRGICSCTAF